VASGIITLKGKYTRVFYIYTNLAMKRGRSWEDAGNMAIVPVSQGGGGRKRRRTNGGPAAVAQRTGFRQLREVEYKVTDTSTTGGNVTSSGTVVNLLASLTRGDDYLNNFLGNKINPAGIQVRYQFRVGDPSNIMRVIIFQWMDSTTPAVSGILQTPTTNLSALLATNKTNINVLHDRVYSGSETYAGALSYMETVPSKTIYIKGKNIYPVEFQAGANTVQKGGLYMLLISDSGAAPTPTASWYIRTTFAD
jgi:hypothetical protein